MEIYGTLCSYWKRVLLFYSHIRTTNESGDKLNNIMKFLGEKKMSVSQLSVLSGVDRSYISNLAAGRRDNPSKKVMENISHALEKDIKEVFFDS